MTPNWASPDNTAHLFNADCLAALPALPEACADIVVVDPPYGINVNANGDLISRREQALGERPHNPDTDPRPIANDGPSEASTLFWELLPECNRILKPGGVVACCAPGGGPSVIFARWILALADVFDFKQMVVWDKGPIGMGWHYRRSYELVLVAVKRGARCQWNDTSGTVENILRPGAYGICKILPSAEQHPTEKPERLFSLFVKLHTQPGQLVVDPCCGRGASGAAAVKLGRRYIGMEIDDDHYARATTRLAEAFESQALFAAATQTEDGATTNATLFEQNQTPGMA